MLLERAYQLRQFSRNIVTTYIARLSNVLGLFVIFPLVGRSVSQEDFGLYVLTSSLAVFFTLDLGMAGATTTYVARAWELRDYSELRRLVASSSVFFLLVGIAGAVVVALTVGIGWSALGIPGGLVQAAIVCTLFAALQVAVGSALSVNRHVLAGVGRLDLANFSQIVQIVLRLSLTITVLSLGGGIVFVAAADLIAVVGAGLFSWTLRRMNVGITISRLSLASLNTLRGMFRLTRDFLIISLAALVILQAGNVIVSLTLPLAAVAVFGSAVRLYQVTREITNSMTAALLPASSTNHARGDSGANSLIFTQGTRLSNVLLLSFAVPIIVFCGPLMNAWMGPGYDEAVPAAQILVLSLVANNLHLIAVPVLGGQGDLRVFARLHVLWALSTVSLGFILAPKMGVLGMAIAVAAPVVVLEPFYVRSALRRLEVGGGNFIKLAFLQPLCVAVVVGIGAFCISAWSWSQTVPGSITFSVLLVFIFLVIYFCFVAPASDRASIKRQLRILTRQKLKY